MFEWWRKLRGLLRRDAIGAEIEEEMRTHVEMKASASDDPAAARRQFGNVTLLMEDSRAVWGWPRLEGWLRDFRYALRGLARNPGFAATVVITLALGIGASATIFSLIDTVLLRPLPYPDSERLVSLREAKLADNRSQTPVAPGRLEDWQRLNKSFEDIAGSHLDPLVDTTGPVPERLSAAIVSPRFFSVFGAPPMLGRTFTPQEEQFGGPLAVVISDGQWRHRFAADPGVLGRSLILNDQTYTIVGVAPPEFQHPNATIEVWVPKQARPDLLTIREARFYNCVGRLKQGVTVEQAQADLGSVQKRLGEQYPKTDAFWGVAIMPLKESLVGNIRPILLLLFGSVSLLLLIACANVACLLLARLNSRAAEIATRCSLGAGRAAIARQLFAEGLVYALLGGLLGVMALFAGIDVLRKQLPDIPRVTELTVDGRMLAVVTGVSVLTAILFSLAPILQTLRRNATASLIRGGRSVAGTRQRLPRFLVSAQIALAMTLLIGAGLFLRSLIKVQESALGFLPEQVLTLRVTASYSERPDPVVQRHRRMLDTLQSIPGVTAVSMSGGLPGVHSPWTREFEIAGEKTPDGTLRFAAWRVVTAGYFQTLGIPILEGRSCTMNTDPQRPFEILVNRSFADQYFSGRDAIGRTIQNGPQGNTAAMVVGVVADAREHGHGVEPQPMIYACGYLRYWPNADVLIQTRNPAALASTVRGTLREIEPARPVYAMYPLADALHEAMSQTRFNTLLVSLFSVLALMLAAIGLYGVMAYMVSQRVREIGIRMALGARRSQIAGDVLRSAGTLAGAGAAAGIAFSVAASRVIGTLLYGVKPSDVTTYLSAIGVLFAVALLACLIPSKRATSVDPTVALREQ